MHCRPLKNLLSELFGGIEISSRKDLTTYTNPLDCTDETVVDDDTRLETLLSQGTTSKKLNTNQSRQLIHILQRKAICGENIAQYFNVTMEILDVEVAINFLNEASFLNDLIRCYDII